jgi:sugar phosphate isomerase/epimerase
LLRDVTDSFHLKDSKQAGGRYQHVPIGQGDGQAPKILADAVARGWDGPVALEPHLSHSGAVAATGPSGVANEAFSNMPHAESFSVAAETAKALMKEIGATVE